MAIDTRDTDETNDDISTRAFTLRGMRPRAGKGGEGRMRWERERERERRRRRRRRRKQRKRVGELSLA